MRRIGLIGVVIVVTMVAVVVNLSRAQEGGGGENHLETGLVEKFFPKPVPPEEILEFLTS